MTDGEVKTFNTLPRPRVTDGGVPNDWHFDLRYIQFEPSPSHVLFMLQPESDFPHMVKLPLEGNELDFFPDTAEEAATEVAIAIVHSFTSSMGEKEIMETTKLNFAPWKLMTEDKALAIEVGKELKRIGVHSDLCNIDVSLKSVTALAQKAFERTFNSIREFMGLDNSIEPSTAIVFQSLRPPPPPRDKIQAYIRALYSAKPPIEAEQEDLESLFTRINTLLSSKPANQVKQEAANGSPDAMVDYALRLTYGIKCTQSRPLSRKYMIQALYSPFSSDSFKSTVHALLIDWYMTASPSTELRARYMYAACHHANAAIALGRAAGAADSNSSFVAPVVLIFLSMYFERLGTLEHFVLYKQAATELAIHKKEIRNGQDAFADVRMKHSDPYRCAAVGCGFVSAEVKLRSCAGNCDSNVKPHYCSKECQVADWKNHKRFCKSGASCSVYDVRPTKRTAQLLNVQRSTRDMYVM